MGMIHILLIIFNIYNLNLLFLKLSLRPLYVNDLKFTHLFACKTFEVVHTAIHTAILKVKCLIMIWSGF